MKKRRLAKTGYGQTQLELKQKGAPRTGLGLSCHVRTRPLLLRPNAADGFIGWLALLLLHVVTSLAAFP